MTDLGRRISPLPAEHLTRHFTAPTTTTTTPTTPPNAGLSATRSGEVQRSLSSNSAPMRSAGVSRVAAAAAAAQQQVLQQQPQGAQSTGQGPVTPNNVTSTSIPSQPQSSQPQHHHSSSATQPVQPNSQAGHSGSHSYPSGTHLPNHSHTSHGPTPQHLRSDTGTLVKFLRLDPSEGFDVGRPSHFILRYDQTGTKLAWAYEDTIKIDVENVLFCNAEGDLIWAKCADERQGLYSAWEENRRWMRLHGTPNGKPRPIKVLSAKAYIDQYNLKHESEAQHVRVLVSKLKRLLAPDAMPPSAAEKAVLVQEQVLQRMERLSSVEQRLEQQTQSLSEFGSSLAAIESSIRRILPYEEQRRSSPGAAQGSRDWGTVDKKPVPSTLMLNHHAPQPHQPSLGPQAPSGLVASSHSTPTMQTPPPGAPAAGSSLEAKLHQLEHRLATLEDRRISKTEHVVYATQRTLDRNADRLLVVEGQLATLINLVGQQVASGNKPPPARLDVKRNEDPVNQASSTNSPPRLNEDRGGSVLLKIGNPPIPPLPPVPISAQSPGPNASSAMGLPTAGGPGSTGAGIGGSAVVAAPSPQMGSNRSPSTSSQSARDGSAPRSLQQRASPDCVKRERDDNQPYHSHHHRPISAARGPPGVTERDEDMDEDMNGQRPPTKRMRSTDS